MRSVSSFFICSLLLLPVLTTGLMAQSAPDMTTVKKVDLDRYLGLWYELARISNRFQSKCVKNITAEYRLHDDGKIMVINTCTKENGDVIKARGVAKVMDSSSNARLRVSFVKLLSIRLFWGDYWIIGLDPEYRYAIVGEPSRKYGWVLSRSKSLSPEDWMDIQKILEKNGYEFDRFLRSVQE